MKGIIKMVICFVAIWGFIKVCPIVLEHVTPYQEVVKNSERLGIDNRALFYSEESHTSGAEQKLKEQLKKSN